MENRTKNVLLLLLLSSCWGPSFLFIKIGLETIPPMMLTTLRIGIGAIILNILLVLQGHRLPRNYTFWKKILISGFFGQGLPFALINWGEQYVDSALASLLNALTPLFTIVLAQVVLKEQLTGNKLKGMLLGLVGLLVLVLPNIISGVSATLYGIITISLSSVSYGIALVYNRKYLTKSPSFQVPAAQLLSVTLYLIPIAMWTEPAFTFSNVSGSSLLAVSSLGLFGTAMAYILYFRILRKTSAGYLSLVTYLMPVYGVFLGTIFLDEKVTIWMVLGASLILIGIFLSGKKQASVHTCDSISAVRPNGVRS